MLLNPNRGIHTFLSATTQSHQGLAWVMNAAMDRGLFQSELVEQILVTWYKDTSPNKQTTVTEVIHYTEADLTIGTKAYTSSFPSRVSQAAVRVQPWQRQVEMTILSSLWNKRCGCINNSKLGVFFLLPCVAKYLLWRLSRDRHNFAIWKWNLWHNPHNMF